MHEHVSVRAAGKGNPWINLGDGHDLLSSYDGADDLCQALAENQAQPLSLTSGDFNEDGVTDLISGYGWSGRGIVMLYQGNADAIYANTRESSQRTGQNTFALAPFLSSSRVFGTPEVPDYVEGGDFDGDGNCDIALAARESDRLWLLSGDGRGTLGEPRAIQLPGRVSAMLAGEINRPDGLEDLVIGVETPAGQSVLVFEGPEGALNSAHEKFPVPSDVRSLALGQLDNDSERDLVIAAGANVIILYGRDRKLSLDETTRSEVAAARQTVRPFGYEIRSIAIGDFSGHRSSEIAVLSAGGDLQLLSPPSHGLVSHPLAEWRSQQLALVESSGFARLTCARVSSIPIDTLMVIDSKRESLQLIGDKAEGWRNRERGTVAAASYDGISAKLDIEYGAAALLPMRLNEDALMDLVILRSGRSAPTVTLTEAQAVFTVTSTADNGVGTLRDMILQANNSLGADTIRFSISGSGVRSIFLSQALPAITDAVTIDGTSQPGFSGSPIIELDGSNFPALPGPGVDGLLITAGASVVRGLVINRFGDDAIELAANGGNVLEGNRLGCDPTGSFARGNIAGVFVNNSPNNIIGGTTVAARNIISGNGRIVNGSLTGLGIQIVGAAATGNQIQGNFIGTNVTGAFALPNAGEGIVIGSFSAPVAGTTIGGTAPGARNVISGNSSWGIIAGSRGALVQGNLIGVNSAGNAAIGNGLDGVSVGGASTVGGTTPAARNVLSGNHSDGIGVSGSNNLVQGNFIGTDVSGVIDLGNDFSGVFLTGAQNSAVGGASIGARNVISGNNTAGLAIELSTGNQIQNNFIGTTVAGNVALGNSKRGISLLGASRNTIGGTDGAGNTIAFNGGEGILIRSDSTGASGNAILSNSIFSNSGLGIRLQPGANNDQGPPALTSVAFEDGTGRIQGVIKGAPNSIFTVQFFSNAACDPSGFGEGQLLVQSAVIQTDTRGAASLSVSAQISSGQRVTATATDANGNTSEFSRCTDPTTQGTDLLIAASASTFTAVTKSLITYSIKVTNGGPGTATGVTVSNPTPAGTQFIFAQASQGSLIVPQFGDTGAISISLGSILPGGVATIKITVIVIASTGSTIVDTATVTSTSSDPNPGSNSATLTTAVITDEELGVSDLSVTTTGSSGTIAAGNRLTYTLRVSNAGPDTARVFSLIDRIPDGTTFAPVSESLCSAPMPGSTGVLQCGLSTLTDGIVRGGSLSFTLRVNILAESGSTLTNRAEIFVPFQSLAAGDGGLGGGVPLQVAIPSDDPNQVNNIATANTPVLGGTLVLLSWQQPTLNPGSADGAKNAAPSNLRLTPPLGPGSLLRRIVLPAESGSCFLKRVHIYKADVQNVQTIPENLWRIVQPDQVEATMASAPAGSFYVLTNVWDCGGMEVESGRSNEVPTSTGPTVNKVTIGPKLKATGSGFSAEVQVFIDNVGFRKQAAVNEGVSLKQKGLLTDGRSIEQAIPFSRTVAIKFVNSNGGTTIVFFTRNAVSSTGRPTRRR